MPDPIATITHAIDIIKRLNELAGKAKRIELREQIVELRSALVDLKEQVAELQERNLQLEESLRSATSQADLRQKIEARDNVYYLKEAIDGRGTGPFCPGCFDSGGKLVKLSKLSDTFSEIGTYQCPVCESPY